MHLDPLTFDGLRKWPVATGWIFFLLALLPGWVPGSAVAQPATARDYEVKAGFLIKFTQYTDWPSNTFAGTNASVIIGVVGGDPVLQQIDLEARGVTIPHPVQVRRITRIEEATNCHVVFISGSESRTEAVWLEALKGKAILTVGDSDLSIEHGAVMRFVLRNRNVQFEASLAAAEENRLTLNERMLAVAARVYKRQSNAGP